MKNTKKKGTEVVRYEQKCKVCNSHFKVVIETMANENLNPRQIWEALASIDDPKEKEIWEKEDIKEATIRRHLQKHYNLKVGAAVKLAETQNRLQKSRDAFKNGVHMKVDAISTLSHLIDVALINLEELDGHKDDRQRHQLTINYMGQITSLVDKFVKLTGDLKNEQTLDPDFFRLQIADLANIVMNTIRKMDRKFGLNYELEYAFGTEFQKEWNNYKDIQEKMINGELPKNYGAEKQKINTFNMISADLDKEYPPNKKTEEETITPNNEEINNVTDVNELTDIYNNLVNNSTNESNEEINTENFIQHVKNPMLQQAQKLIEQRKLLENKQAKTQLSVNEFNNLLDTNIETVQIDNTPSINNDLTIDIEDINNDIDNNNDKKDLTINEQNNINNYNDNNYFFNKEEDNKIDNQKSITEEEQVKHNIINNQLSQWKNFFKKDDNN